MVVWYLMHKTAYSPAFAIEEITLTRKISVYTLTNGSKINKVQKLFSVHKYF